MDVSRPSEPETRPAAVPRQRAAETEPSPTTPDAARRPAPGRPGRLRRLLLVALLAVGLAGAGVVGYGFIWYDQQTKPDRSTPEDAVSNYLRALLVDRDDTRADLFACRDSRDLDPIRELRETIEERERRLNVSVFASWSRLDVRQRSDRSATVATEIRQTAAIDNNMQSVADRWTFQVEERDGWRVCGSTRTG